MANKVKTKPLWRSYPNLVSLKLNRKDMHTAFSFLVEQQYDCLAGFPSEPFQSTDDKIIWYTPAFWFGKSVGFTVTTTVPVLEAILYLVAFRFKHKKDALLFRLSL